MPQEEDALEAALAQTEARIVANVTALVERKVAEARRLALEEAAKHIEGISMAQILLQGGEMTAQERRTVKAVQGMFAHAIREIDSRAIRKAAEQKI